MKNLIYILFTICHCSFATADDPFIKIIDDPQAGSTMRIVNTPDNGWAVFTMDNLKLYKFSSCGILEWTKKYDIPNPLWNSNAFIATQSGGFAFMTRIQINANVHNTIITKLDSSGNILWCKLIGDLDYNHFPYTLNEYSSGELILYGNVHNVTTNTHHNMIVKISPGGNLLWTKFYSWGGIWGGAFITDDNGVLARTGSMFIKTDQSGNIQWTKRFQTDSSYGYYAPVEVNDGFIFTTYNNPGTSYINFHKMDKQGNLLWNNYKRTSLTGIPPVLRKNNNGNIICAFYKAVIEFDSNFNIINQSSIDMTAGFTGSDVCITTNGNTIVAGYNNNLPFVAKLDPQFNFSCNFPLEPVVVTNLGMTHTIHSTTSVDYTMQTQNHIVNFTALNYTHTSVCKLIKVLDLGSDTTLCSGTNFILSNISSDVFDNYLWSTGETTATININEPGTYWLRVDYNCGEDVLTDTIEINLHSVVEIELGTDLLECDSVKAVLIAPPCLSCNYTWSTGDTNSIITASEPGKYWLIVKDSNNCSYSDSINIEIAKCDCHVYVPSAFTPNNDGTNEVFIPVFYCDMQEYYLTVYNRWGEIIYSSQNNHNGWNGKVNGEPVATGIYVYRVEYIPLKKRNQQQKVVKMGTIAVIY